MKGFFSYARVDAEASLGGPWVDRVREVLETQTLAENGDRDFALWQDRKALRFGDEWRQEIKDAIAAAPFFFVLLSPGWVKSDWCRWEFDLFQRHHPGRHPFVIRFRPVDWSDPEIACHRKDLDKLNQVHHADLQNLAQQDEGEIRKTLQKMAQDLGAKVRAARRAVPSPPPAVAASPPVAIADGRRIVDGYLDMPSQSGNRVVLDIGFIERAVTEVRGRGRVIFGVLAATLTTSVSSGRITAIRTDFARGFDPPRVAVVVQPTAGKLVRHIDLRSCDGSTLSGNPLRDRTESGGPIELFSVEDAEPGLTIEGRVKLDITGLHVEEDRPACANPPDQAARVAQLRKLSELVLKKHGADHSLGSYRRDT